MASNLKVDQLRAKLAQRGLSTAGTKAILVQRLEEAVEEENKKSVGSKKRGRECDETDSNGSQKVKSIESFGQMGVKQLREQADLRGLSKAGTKKELLERLCNHAEQSDSKDTLLQEEVNECKDEKIVKATKKGAAVLDPWLPEHIKISYHDNDIYDAMLNQTNVGDNNNKFYVIQLLESDGGGEYMVYNRWGRVGMKGQDKIFGPYNLQDTAINEFEQKFFAKTKNHWSNRRQFTSYPKCYTWLEMDYSANQKEESVVHEKPNSTINIQPRNTKLEPCVAKFISLICNISMMKQLMMEIGYNANKLPLGKLSKSTILKGYDVLKRIADVIHLPDRRKLEELSGILNFNFKEVGGTQFLISIFVAENSTLLYLMTLDLKKCVEALGEIEVATKLLEDDTEIQIANYLLNTHAKTHSAYSVDIVQIFRVEREGETERFRKFSNSKNRMLLWHGSRLTNWTGILSQGLRIAPPEAPATGYMFGKGVYFADMFSKSANYCYASPSATAGVLLLCEVALGDMSELLYANYDADKLPDGKLSTKGVGQTAPDPLEAETLEDGVIVPLGKPKEQLNSKGHLLYNEYIVYSVDQIRMRYVVQVNFKYK
ncbi:poly (ADP-ribose) polymerase 2 [Citrus sinensis]|uniref:Poly (ADP-ribose) polymerase 2 n=1 Tax=Citrus sinensis TaxID=2711 RepID=A0ACB8MLD7_CITSI|nr:poly (ADP-ribose) polymerase 2 [Citrus sinensis]